MEKRSHFFGSIRRTIIKVTALSVALLLSLGVCTVATAQLSFSGSGLSNVAGDGSTTFLDADGDGDLDLLMTGSNGGFGLYRNANTSIYENSGGSYSENTTWKNELEDVAVSNVAVKDIDGDGDPDIVMAGGRNVSGVTEIDEVAVYENRISEGNGFVNVDNSLPGEGLTHVSLTDIDQDGDPDLLLHQQGLLYENDGNGNFTKNDTWSESLPSFTFTYAQFADADGDGDPDALFMDRDNAVIFENGGSGTFTENSSWSQNLTGAGKASVEFVDINSNGAQDLVITGLDKNSNPVVTTYENKVGEMASSFTVNSTWGGNMTALERSDISSGDIDGDGDPDLLMIGEDKNGDPYTTLYLNIINSGTRELSPSGVSLTDVTLGSTTFGSITNDGKLDMVVSGQEPDTTIVYLNTSASVNTTPGTPSGLSSSTDNADETTTLSWNAASDTETDDNALTYNVYVRPQAGGDFAVSPNAFVGGADDGFRKIYSRGNAEQVTSKQIALRDLTEKTTYDWSVQTLDASWLASTFPTAGSFTTPVYADLSLLATSDDSELVVGGQTTLTFTVTNSDGTDNASGVTVDVTLPGGLSLQGSSTSDGSYSSGTWSVGSISANGTATLELTVQKDALPDQTINTSLASLDQADLDSTNDTATVTINKASVDLGLTATGDDRELSIGQQTTLTFTLSHKSGNYDATGLDIGVTLPDNLSVLSNNASSGTYSGSTWSFNTFTTGSSATLELTVEPDNPDPATIALQIDALDQQDTDASNDNISWTLSRDPESNGQAIALDGNGDYVDAESGIALDNRSFSIEFWAKRTSTGNDHFVIGQGPDGSSNQSLHIGFRSSNTFTFAFLGMI